MFTWCVKTSEVYSRVIQHVWASARINVVQSCVFWVQILIIKVLFFCLTGDTVVSLVKLTKKAGSLESRVWCNKKEEKMIKKDFIEKVFSTQKYYIKLMVIRSCCSNVVSIIIIKKCQQGQYEDVQLRHSDAMAP